MNILKTIAASAAVAFGLAAAPSAAQQPGSSALICQGQLFGGNYIVDPHPSFAPLTAENFNAAARETLVATVQILGGSNLLITPVDVTMPCEDFMEKIGDTGLVKNIGPNWMAGIGPVP